MVTLAEYYIEIIPIFLIVIILSLYIDLRGHQKETEPSLLSASLWTIFWIALAFIFYAYIWLRFDPHWANLYITGYILEKSLSIDNLMVFIAIFSAFGIKGALQRSILYWGILGALILRGIFVVIGVGLLNAAPWVGFVFALIIIWTAFKMLGATDENETITDYSNHWSVRWTEKFIPVYPHLVRRHLMISSRIANALRRKHPNTKYPEKAVMLVTPAFLCLVVIEFSDIAFAFDSVPAVISVTQEPFLIYAAMIFAILGLRSLYFVLSALTRYLVYLEKAVVILLFFIGIKMMLHSWNTVIGDTGIHISTTMSLSMVASILGIGIVLSLIKTKLSAKK